MIKKGTEIFMKKALLILLVLALAFTVVMTVSCAKKNVDEETTAETTSKETEPETTAEETQAPQEVPEFTNPLTGLASDTDLSKKRPVSIMINNINVSLPQEGIGAADIMFECMAEGGITRLMMLSTEYEKLTKVGSVRSARDYYIDYAEGFDCIFVHAGGSPYAYSTISNRAIQNIDGVAGKDLTGSGHCFFRDPERLGKYSSEHTLMLKSGEELAAAINNYGYRTEKAEGYETPMNFVPYLETATLENKATHVKVVMSNYQIVDFVFAPEQEGYLRYQYNGDPHIDNTTGEQLKFKNVILVFTSANAIAGDDKNRISVGTTGSGNGWYITEGTYQKITWQKDSHDSVMKYFYEDGTEVQLNRGKTMINVVPVTNESLVEFNDEWTDAE